VHIFDSGPMFHVKLKKPEIGINDDGDMTICHVTNNIYAEMIDRHETAIYDAIVRGAEEAGITDAYLLDKDFIISAIREKMDRDDKDRSVALAVLKEFSRDMYPSYDLFGNKTLVINRDKFEAIRKKYLDVPRKGE